MDKLTFYADKVIEYLFYALFFFVPLLLWPKTSEVFEFNKMLFVYAVTTLVLASWIAKWIAAKKITIRRTPLDLPILLFFVAQGLSTIFSIDTHTSLWGYYSRFHGGLMSTISYLILYYAFVSNIKPITVRYILLAILSSAVLVASYAILEHFGIDKHLWVQDVQSRVFSTIGQPNWLSAYLVALLPLSIFSAIHQKSKLQSVVYGLVSGLFLAAILFTKSQSGLMTTGLILIAIIVYLLGKKSKLIYLLVVPLLVFLVILKWNFILQITPFGLPDLERRVTADQKTRFAGSDSMIIRQVVWQGARDLGRLNPIFGTGVETFGYSYFTVRPTLHNLLSEWEFLYNKAHNEYLNTLATTGFVGLTTYLLLIIWTLFWWFKNLKIENSLKIENWNLKIALLFGYASILITNYFGFSVVPVALFFFLFPALVFTISKAKEEYLTINFHINRELALLFLLPTTIYLLLIPIGQWRADLAYNTGKLYLSINAYKQSLSYLSEAISISPNEPLFLAQLAEAQAISATAIKSQLDALPASASANMIANGKALLKEFEDDALKNSQRAVDLNPYHTNLYKSKAKVELYLATIKPEYNQKAVETLKALSILSPTDAKVIYNLGLIYDQLGEKSKAQEQYKKALALKPDYDAARALINP